MVVGWYKVCFGIGCGRGSPLWVWWRSFLGVPTENEAKQGSRKIGVLVVTDPPQKILTFFFGFVSMWVKLSENIFWG